ncbi:hypothetical protein [Streptomyces sp. NPDC088348]|uniref:hypothetical protein n=1 Tax=Streptomyces sp. NPDC088348 TaxID=3365853 RepID=UPI0038242BD1
MCLYEHRDYNASGQGDIWIVKSDVPDLGKWGGSNVVSSIVLNSTDPDSRAYLYDLATPGLNGGVGSVWLKVSNRARIPDLREVLVHEKKLVEQPGYNDTVVTETAWRNYDNRISQVSWGKKLNPNYKPPVAKPLLDYDPNGNLNLSECFANNTC